MSRPVKDKRLRRAYGVLDSPYAISLGIAACMKGHNVLFASVPNLIVELKETMSNNQFTNYRRRFETYDLVILDEFGYVSLCQNRLRDAV